MGILRPSVQTYLNRLLAQIISSLTRTLFFRLPEEGVHDDACAVLEACAEARQDAARDQEFPEKAALAASCVGTLANALPPPLSKWLSWAFMRRLCRREPTCSGDGQTAASFFFRALAPVVLRRVRLHYGTALGGVRGGRGVRGVLCTIPPGATQPMMESPALFSKMTSHQLPCDGGTRKVLTVIPLRSRTDVTRLNLERDGRNGRKMCHLTWTGCWLQLCE